MSSPETAAADAASLGPVERSALLKLAWESIRSGLERGRACDVGLADLPARLGEPRAAFVTLHQGEELRGCIGSLEATRPLAIDVAENAYRSAFCDPRFPPLRGHEVEGLDIHIAVLSPPEPICARSEAELLGMLRPRVDGLILRDGAFRGTFLPQVWESLPDSREFLIALKRKAGLPADHWSDGLEIHRYTAENIP